MLANAVYLRYERGGLFMPVASTNKGEGYCYSLCRRRRPIISGVDGGIASRHTTELLLY